MAGRFDFYRRPAGDILCSRQADSNQVAKAIGANTYAMYSTLANGATVVSQSITTTTSCLIVIAAVVTKWQDFITWNIERGGVNVTVGRQQSVLDGGGLGTLLLWAHERLPAGTYTYNLVNRTGGTEYWTAADIKVYAIQN